MKDSIVVLPKVLVVDDEINNLQVMKLILQDSYQLSFAKNGMQALEIAEIQRPDLILLDVMMPELDGYETCRRLKAHASLCKVPVIFVTAMTEVEDESRGFEVGAVDYITKPISAPIVHARIRTHLSLVSVEEILHTRIEIIRRLGRAAEFRDNETGMHVIRMSHYAASLARAAGLSENESELILNASPMHDVGKIGIPDSILLKPGPLSPEEWVVMRQHTSFGAEIIGDHQSHLLDMARCIAQCHHERWDGKGYPQQLEGEGIPLVARITTIADVFDALTTKRPYKDAWTVDKALAFIRAGQGTQFDPCLVDHFFSIMPEIVEIKEKWAEH